MAERNLDFDAVIQRRGTGSLKYDCAAERGKPEGILPLWVADMDFRTSSYVQDALEEAVTHGIWGYSEPGEGYFAALESWMKKHHNWEIRREWGIRTPGVVFALAMAVQAYTEPGDAILLQQPVYYPFSGVIRDNGRRIVSSDLLYDREQGTYRMDLSDLEEKIRAEKVKLLLLCNPHNPVGRVWEPEELRALGEICKRCGVIVVSDEIHADFVYEKKHTVFALAGEGFEDFSVICTSPTKTFNMAGLQISNILIPDPELRKRFRHQVDAAGYSQANALGLRACEAAYRDGEEWLEALLRYLRGNRDFLEEYLKKNMPRIRMVRVEGTYLAWLDLNDLGLSPREREDRIVHRAGLWLDRGEIFGRTGEGFERINFACPRSVLREALEKLKVGIGDGS
ncbi:MAG: pyridoxal phosphate-dependent aminotransferase [Lachnospiraceae bacterium]|nr:pyridoxal phosphate-dependent aminotransferase [Lachnospiraceae bacterium]